MYTDLSVYILQVVLNCRRKISLLVGRRKAGMVIYLRVGEDHIFIEKIYLFLPVFAKLDQISLEVLLRWGSKLEKKMLCLQQSIFYCMFRRFCFPFQFIFKRISRLKVLAWADTILNPFWAKPWLCKLNLEYCSIQLPVFVKSRVAISRIQ